ncbi:hypothetical protein PFISCL1PPCAC_8526, partial [Pristionchus fissidentatus]
DDIQGSVCITDAYGSPMCDCPADLEKSVYGLDGPNPKCKATVWIVASDTAYNRAYPHHREGCEKFTKSLDESRASNRFLPKFECFQGKHVSDMVNMGGYQCDFGNRQGRFFAYVEAEPTYSLMTYTGKET